MTRSTYYSNNNITHIISFNTLNPIERNKIDHK